MLQDSNQKGIKTSGGSADSKEKQQSHTYRASFREELYFEIEIKRESRFFSKWKKRSCSIVYTPNEELSLTIKNKEKIQTIEEILNLRNTKISKRCSVVEQHHCFGLEIATGKRYLIGRETETKTLVMFDNISRLKKYFKQKPMLEQQLKNNSNNHAQIKPAQVKLQFEQSNLYEDKEEIIMQKQENEFNEFSEMKSTKTSPIKMQLDCREFERQIQKNGAERPMMVEENDDDYCTVMEEQPVDIMKKQPQIHLKIPLNQQEKDYLSSDEGFKLRQNFAEGRILEKGGTVLKVNLLLKTHLSQFQLLQSFFHFQLWNGRVSKYQVLNRIDEGIYLVYVQFKKNWFFSAQRYCYLMVTAVVMETEPYLIFKSLQKSDFEVPASCQWLEMCMWAKVGGCDSQSLQKCFTVCLRVQDEDLNLGLSLVEQLKLYQSFLFTTYKLPFQILDWRREQKIIFP